jgi:3-deoxy-D-manno-octulosonate 8-phosphate phosphatase (KDO 8-P phosphatase)
LSKIEDIFTAAGGQFLSSPALIKEKLASISTFLFDWDGVFNTGTKGEGVGSTFTETDSMGTNLLRYSHSQQHSRLPFVGIITGENNHTAYSFAKREHFDAVYFGFKNKKAALEHLIRQHKIKASEICFVFDDVLDLPIAKEAGLRFFVKNPGSLVFHDYVRSNALCDYITGSTGGSNAIREVCELLLALGGTFEKVIEDRVNFSPSYSSYFTKRNTGNTIFYREKDGNTIKVDMP